MDSPAKRLRNINKALMRKRSDNSAYQQQHANLSSCDSPPNKQRHHSFVSTPPYYHNNLAGDSSASSTSSPVRTNTGTPPLAGNLASTNSGGNLRHVRFRRSFRSSMKKFNFSKVFDGFRQSMAQTGSPPATAGRHSSGGGGGGAQSSMASTPAERKEGQQCDERLPQVDALIQPELFAWGEIMRRGFPFQPTCMDYDPLQNLIAIGTKSGHVRIMGRPGVDRAIKHEDRAAVAHVHFIKNEGALLTVCPDDTLHLWSFRQQAKLERQHKLKFQKESISVVSAPFQSKFIFVGTDKGNIYTVSIETFQLTPYQIAWNKAIGLQEIAHPGACIVLSDCPNDANMLLVGFDSGLMILWDLKARVNRARFNSSVSPNVTGQFPPGEQQHVQQQQLLGLTSLKWHWDDRSRFVSSHLDGSLAMWSVKQPHAPISVHYPHGKHSPLAAALNSTATASDKSAPKTIEFPTPIGRVDWRAYSRASSASPRPGSVHYDGLMIFSGGIQMPSTTSQTNEQQQQQKSDADTALVKRSRFDITTITLQHGASVNVLEMDHGIIDFLTTMPTPWPNSSDDPIALLVLLKGDLVAIDLKTPGFPAIANPYPMSIHESPVTSCVYLADCKAEVIQQLFVAGKKQQQQSSANDAAAVEATALSQKPWPISGGNWGSSAHSRLELVLTGHHDGSIKVWDASTQMLQLLLKIKTRTLFEKPPHFTVMSVASSSSSSSSTAVSPQPATASAAQQRQQQWYNSTSSADSCASSVAGPTANGSGAVAGNNLNVPAGARRMRSPSPSQQYRNASPGVTGGGKSGANGASVDPRLFDGLFAVKMMAISKDATLMAAAGNAGQIYVYELAKHDDQITDIQNITIPVIIGYSDDDSNDDIEANAEPPLPRAGGGRQLSKEQLISTPGGSTPQQLQADADVSTAAEVVSDFESLSIATKSKKLFIPGSGISADISLVEDFGKLMLKPQSGVVRRHAGYRLNCIVMPQLSTDHKRSIRGEIWAHYNAHFATNHCLSVFPPPVTALAVSSHFGTVAFGTDCGFAVVDTIQHYCLISLPTSELYGPADPWIRLPYLPLEPLTCVCVRKEVGVSTAATTKRRESPKSDGSIAGAASVENYAANSHLTTADPFAVGSPDLDEVAAAGTDNIEVDVESAVAAAAAAGGEEIDEGIGSRADSQNTSSTNTLLSDSGSSSKTKGKGLFFNIAQQQQQRARSFSNVEQLHQSSGSNKISCMNEEQDGKCNRAMSAVPRTNFASTAATAMMLQRYKRRTSKFHEQLLQSQLRQLQQQKLAAENECEDTSVSSGGDIFGALVAQRQQQLQRQQRINLSTTTQKRDLMANAPGTHHTFGGTVEHDATVLLNLRAKQLEKLPTISGAESYEILVEQQCERDVEFATFCADVQQQEQRLHTNSLSSSPMSSSLLSVANLTSDSQEQLKTSGGRKSPFSLSPRHILHALGRQKRIADDNSAAATGDVGESPATKQNSSSDRLLQRGAAVATTTVNNKARGGWLGGNGRTGSNDAAQAKPPPNALSNEAITALLFADTLAKKNDAETCSALWLGTNTGYVTLVDLNLPRNRADRLSQTSFPAPCSSVLLRIPPLPVTNTTGHSKSSNASSPTSPTHSSASAAAAASAAAGSVDTSATLAAQQQSLQSLIYSDALLRSTQRVLHLALLDQNGCLCDESSFHYNNEVNLIGSGTPGPVVADGAAAGLQHEKLGPKLSGGDISATAAGQRRSRQYLVMVGPQQARVVTLPTHVELYSCSFEKALGVDNADSALALRAHVTNVPTAERVTTSWPPALVLHLRSQRVAIFSLPTLRLVQCTELVQPGRLSAMSATAVRRLNHTLSFGGHAHLLYMPSPSELVFGSVSAHVTQQTESIAPQLFTAAVIVPEPPKPSFMKGLFGLVGSQSLTQSIDEREELLGQVVASGAEGGTTSSAAAATGVARYSGSTQQANTKGARTQAQGAGSAISQAKMMALERGEKLGELEDRTERMKNEAESYSSNAQKLMEKYRDKKWYNPF